MLSGYRNLLTYATPGIMQARCKPSAQVLANLVITLQVHNCESVWELYFFSCGHL